MRTAALARVCGCASRRGAGMAMRVLAPVSSFSRLCLSVLTFYLATPSAAA